MAKVKKLQPVENVDENQQIDNGQENPLTETEMAEMSEQKENSEKEFRFIIIGGNDSSLSAAILKVISEYEQQVSVFEMDNDEMKFIINSRAQKKAEETSVDYIANPENKKRIQDWCKMLIENFIKQNFKNGEFLLKEVLDGRQQIWMTKKDLKKASNLSWSQFEELYGTLQLFGVVEFNEDEKNEFTLLLDSNQIIENKVNEAMQMLKLTNGKFASLLEDNNLNAEQKKNIKSLKTKISNILK
jgi:Fe-S cluster assembly iron-binding protein IscA